MATCNFRKNKQHFALKQAVNASLVVPNHRHEMSSRKIVAAAANAKVLFIRCSSTAPSGQVPDATCQRWSYNLTTSRSACILNSWVRMSRARILLGNLSAAQLCHTAIERFISAHQNKWMKPVPKRMQSWHCATCNPVINKKSKSKIVTKRCGPYQLSPYCCTGHVIAVIVTISKPSFALTPWRRTSIWYIFTVPVLSPKEVKIAWRLMIFSPTPAARRDIFRKGIAGARW